MTSCLVELDVLYRAKKWGVEVNNFSGVVYRKLGVNVNNFSGVTNKFHCKFVRLNLRKLRIFFLNN